LTKRLKSRITPLILAAILVTMGSLPMGFLHPGGSMVWSIYILAVLQGVGISIMLNVSTSLISDVIGDDNTSSAFVYGAYSFADKIVNGILISLLIGNYASNGYALRWILCLVPTFSAGLALLCAYTGTKLYSDRINMLSATSD